MEVEADNDKALDDMTIMDVLNHNRRDFSVVPGASWKEKFFWNFTGGTSNCILFFLW